MAAIYFFIAYKELKNAQTAQINPLFELLNLICANGDAFFGFTHILMSIYVNNDVSKDSPISPRYEQ